MKRKKFNLKEPLTEALFELILTLVCFLIGAGVLSLFSAEFDLSNADFDLTTLIGFAVCFLIFGIIFFVFRLIIKRFRKKNGSD